MLTVTPRTVISVINRPLLMTVSRMNQPISGQNTVDQPIRSKSSNPAQYCLDTVQRTDHEHFLTNLLLPASVKTDAFAVRALSSEISGVRDSVSDKTLGQVRLQFWIDTVQGLYDDQVPQHPVAVQIYRTIKQNNVSKQLLINLISSRLNFLSDKPFNSLDDVDKYGEEAFSSVYLILLEVMKNKNGHVKHAATQLGKCEGLLTLLRGLAHNAAKRRCYLPTQLLVEKSVSAEQVIRTTGDNISEDISEVIEIIAARAEQHLEACRLRRKYLSRDEKLLLLPAVAADQYLSKLSRVKCNVWDKSLHTRNSWLPLSLYWNKFRATY